MTVGELRDWLLSYDTTSTDLAAVAWGLTPEMVAAVSKIMGNQDLVLVASKCSNVTAFRSTIGLPGRLAVRLQPNHPTDDLRGIMAADRRRVAPRLRRRGDRDQPRARLAAAQPAAARHARRVDRPLRDPDSVVRARPRDDDAAGDRRWRAGRSRVPVDRRHRGRQPVVRDHARSARRGARRGALAAARHRR